jgi:hypothetical protein
MPLFYPNISQVYYFGVGDIDECSIIASFWAARQAGFTGRLPTIRQFRTAAGVPDRPGPTGLTNAQVYQGLTRTGMSAGAAILGRGTTWSDFTSKMSAGVSASVALLSAALPVGYRYGFQGAHRVGLTWDKGQWYIANPLAPEGSGPQAISEQALKRAVLAMSGTTNVFVDATGKKRTRTRAGGSVIGIIFTGGASAPVAATPAITPPPSVLARLAIQLTPQHRVDAFSTARFYDARPHKRV